MGMHHRSSLQTGPQEDNFSEKPAATMKLPVVVLLALLGYCLCVPTTEIRGVLRPMLELSESECWLRVKVESCSDVVWLELFGAQGYRSSRHVRPYDGEGHACLPLPCDADSRVTGKTVLTGDGTGKVSVTVEPDTFVANFHQLYSEQDQCMAGRNGDDAVVTCEGASDTMIEEIKGELENVAEIPMEHDFITEYQGGTVYSQWQNDYDKRLDVTCPSNYAFFRVQSQNSNRAEDRKWEWSCRKAAEERMDCSWTGYVNNFDQPVLFHCPKNQVIAGVESYHDNGYEDRKWRFRCCEAPNHFTRNCYLSNFINNWDGNMDFMVNAPQVFTGVYSIHDNGKEDRRWKIAVCDFSYCQQVV